MNLRMIPTGLSMTHRTKLGDKAEKWERVTFELRHAGRDGLKLETGEVFQNPQWASYKKSQKNLITPAYLYVIALDSGRPSEMFYHEAGYGCNASIEFRVFIAQNDYDLLLDNLRAGLTPSLVTVELQWDYRDKDGPLAFDAPDGSEKIWRNTKEENRRVGIEAIEFRYRLMGEDDLDGEDWEDAKPSTVKASIDAVAAKLDGWEKAFVKGVKGATASVTAIGLVIAAWVILYSIFHK